MSADLYLDVDPSQGVDPIQAITEDVFTAMVDGEPGHLVPVGAAAGEPVDALHAWVDVRGTAFSGRVLLTTETGTADRLTRALLGMDAAEAVTDDDRVDAFGEIANVVGGNVKALATEPAVLTLPCVAGARPESDPDALLHSVAFVWRGDPLLITLWRLA